jgi:hypothetical protein
METDRGAASDEPAVLSKRGWQAGSERCGHRRPECEYLEEAGTDLATAALEEITFPPSRAWNVQLG